MKVGDLVESIHDIPQRGEQSTGIIVDIDPLRRGKSSHITAVNEIVVMLDNGVLWHASPDTWKIINESR